MHRVHDARYAANLFNPSQSGNARFSPIRDEVGVVIPTLYAATTPRGALMETTFHDVPYKSGFKRDSTSRMAGKLHSTLTFQVDFRLIDLSRVALRKLGVAPSHLIDTTKAHLRYRVDSRSSRCTCPLSAELTPHARLNSRIGRHSKATRSKESFIHQSDGRARTRLCNNRQSLAAT
jgi:hypothetical protein